MVPIPPFRGTQKQPLTKPPAHWMRQYRNSRGAEGQVGWADPINESRLSSVKRLVCHWNDAHKKQNALLGGGFNFFLFIFTPTWGNDPNLTHISQMGGKKPPTRLNKMGLNLHSSVLGRSQ